MVVEPNEIRDQSVSGLGAGCLLFCHSFDDSDRPSSGLSRL